MKVILKENVKKLGQKDQIIDVSEGYARNMLFPKKLAIEATPKAIQQLKNKKGRIAQSKEEAKEMFQADLEKLAEKTVTIQAKSDDTGKLYGSISLDIVLKETKKQTGVSLEARQVNLDHPIKETGVHSVPVKDHGVSGHINIKVQA